MGFYFNTNSITPSTGSGGGSQINNQDKTITANGEYTADEGYTGLGTVTVNVPNPSTGTLSVTANGIFDVTNYASANVNVPAGSDQKYGATIDSFLGSVNSSGVLQPVASDMNLVFTGVRNIENNALEGALQNNLKLASVSFPDLTEVSNSNALRDVFAGCKNLISASFPVLTDVTFSSPFQNVFNGCSRLSTLEFPLLENANGGDCFNSAFFSCSSLTSVEFPKLRNINMKNGVLQASGGFRSVFASCSSLASVSFPLLESVGMRGLSSAFSSCSSLGSITFPSLSLLHSESCANMCMFCSGLSSLSFPALKSTSFGSYTNQFNKMLLSVTGCTVHFPSNLQSVIGSWSDVTNGFGGTNTVVLFDLPATT